MRILLALLRPLASRCSFLSMKPLDFQQVFENLLFYSDFDEFNMLLIKEKSIKSKIDCKEEEKT